MVLFKIATNDGKGFCAFPDRVRNDTANPANSNLPTFSISGTISGHLDNGLVIQNNNSEQLPISFSGNSFSFLSKVSNFNVSIKSSVMEDCTINNGVGTATADVTNITINCDLKTLNILGNVTTIVGFAYTPGAVDGVGSAARFNQPTGIAFDSNNLYIADYTNHRIRKMDLTTRAVTTLNTGSALSLSILLPMEKACLSQIAPLI